ncbi:MAG: hypothetical protein Q7S58_01470 [Candidatus Binatus sp.]|uniref:hypothetical protein n=1 Tax=Candidatus Binatus sp. TaxID=2811406 RepID=UPI0027187ED5|nr:hypothetical protein [Candidatus Binatus sp.]MDO8431059.1 hypothetical protein [Candidatus Binatus sp.]
MAARIAVIASLALVCAASYGYAQDDWKVIERHTNSGPAESSATPAPKAGATLIACGEQAELAGEPYKSVVAQLNDMWGTSFPVYESTRAISPHAHAGGCIFYNGKYLDSLLQQWMNIRNEDEVRPMLYAIFAHEQGHLAHGDFDASADDVPIKNKELAADQFAGFTLERLGIRRLDATEITRYYQLTGDDFVGHGSGHGSGEERTTAFQDGWHRAQVGLPEQGTRPAGGLGQP